MIFFRTTLPYIFTLLCYRFCTMSAYASPYVAVFPGAQGFPAASPSAANVVVAGLQSARGAALAPNYVWQSAPKKQDVSFEVENDILDSCRTRPVVCMDAATRGMLSGLQPVLMPSTETLFPEDATFFMRAARPAKQ